MKQLFWKSKGRTTTMRMAVRLASINEMVTWILKYELLTRKRKRMRSVKTKFERKIPQNNGVRESYHPQNKSRSTRLS